MITHCYQLVHVISICHTMRHKETLCNVKIAAHEVYIMSTVHYITTFLQIATTYIGFLLRTLSRIAHCDQQISIFCHIDTIETHVNMMCSVGKAVHEIEINSVVHCITAVFHLPLYISQPATRYLISEGPIAKTLRCLVLQLPLPKPLKSGV